MCFVIEIVLRNLISRTDARSSSSSSVRISKRYEIARFLLPSSLRIAHSVHLSSLHDLSPTYVRFRSPCCKRLLLLVQVTRNRAVRRTPGDVRRFIPSMSGKGLENLPPLGIKFLCLFSLISARFKGSSLSLSLSLSQGRVTARQVEINGFSFLVARLAILSIPPESQNPRELNGDHPRSSTRASGELRSSFRSRVKVHSGRGTGRRRRRKRRFESRAWRKEEAVEGKEIKNKKRKRCPTAAIVG